MKPLNETTELGSGSAGRNTTWGKILGCLVGSKTASDIIADLGGIKGNSKFNLGTKLGIKRYMIYTVMTGEAPYWKQTKIKGLHAVVNDEACVKHLIPQIKVANKNKLKRVTFTIPGIPGKIPAQFNTQYLVELRQSLVTVVANNAEHVGSQGEGTGLKASKSGDAWINAKEIFDALDDILPALLDIKAGMEVSGVSAEGKMMTPDESVESGQLKYKHMPYKVSSTPETDNPEFSSDVVGRQRRVAKAKAEESSDSKTMLWDLTLYH